MKILEGITSILGSAKGVMVLILMGDATYLGMHGHLDMATAAVFGTLGSIFLYCHTRMDHASLGCPAAPTLPGLVEEVRSTIVEAVHHD